MVQVILVWVGVVVALGLLLVMALGPAVVAADAWWHERRKAARTARSAPE